MHVALPIPTLKNEVTSERAVANSHDNLGWRYLIRLLTPTFLPFAAICVVFFALLALLGIGFMRQIAREVEQELSWEVADNVASRLPPLVELLERSAIPEVFSELAAANPECEPYILDHAGNIIYPKKELPLHRVAMEPIRAALRHEIPDVIFTADDPLRPGHHVQFVAASLPQPGEEKAGILYLVIRSRLLTAFEKSSGAWQMLCLFFLRLLPFLVACLVLGLFFALSTTRAFRRILSLLRYYAQGNLDARWHLRANDDINELGRSIDLLAREVVTREAEAKGRELRRRAVILEIVHDVRSPLMGIRAAVEVMLRESRRVGKGISDDLERSLLSGVRSIHNLAEALRGSADLDASEPKLQCTRIHPETIVSPVISQLRSTAAARGIRMEVRVAPSLPHILGDGAALERIIGNLIDNALRHTPSGGGIFVEADQSDGIVRLAVRDTGVGIPATELPFIFDRFFRGTTQNLAQGAGVGLTIVKKIAELHGGCVRAESILGEGSTFIVELPSESKGSAVIDPPLETLKAEAPTAMAYLRNPRLPGFFMITVITAVCVLFLMPHHVSASVMFFYGIVSVWIGYSGARLQQSIRRVTGALIALASYGYWYVSTPRPYLSLVPVLLGLSLGVGFAALLRTTAGKRSYLRLFYLCLILNTLSIGWATHVLHSSAEDELARFATGTEGEYLNRLSQEISSFWCHSQVSPTDDTIAAFHRIQSLNRKSELFLTGSDGEIRLGSKPGSLDLYEENDIVKANSAFNSTRRILAFPRLRLAVRAPLHSCKTGEAVTVAFCGKLFDFIFRSTAHRNDAIFAMLSSIVAILLFLVVRRKTTWPHDELILEMKHVVQRDWSAPTPAISMTALSQPILQPLTQLIERADTSRVKAESSDAELRRTASLAAEEYRAFSETLGGIAALLKPAAAEQSTSDSFRGSLQVQLRRLESLVESERMLTQALFETSRSMRRKQEVKRLYLAELLDSAVLEQIGALDVKKLAVQQEVDSDTVVSGDENYLKLILSALLHGLSRAADFNTRLSVQSSPDKRGAVLIFRIVKSDTSLPGSVAARTDDLPMGVSIALELSRLSSIDPQIVFDQTDGSLQEVSLRFNTNSEGSG